MDTLVDLASLGFDSFLACLIVGALGARALLPALPLLLSVDNLCTELPSGMALPAGAASGAMAALGLYVASTVRSLLPTPRPGR
jgi:hypothetical protein